MSLTFDPQGQKVTAVSLSVSDERRLRFCAQMKSQRGGDVWTETVSNRVFEEYPVC